MQALRKYLRPVKDAVLFLYNVVFYRNISKNLNSRKYWNRRLAHVGNFWRNEHYYELLKYLPREMHIKLLDVGCAIGDGTELLAAELPLAEIHGCDISETGIAKARVRSGRVRYRVMDIRHDVIDQVYDYITIVETLEHFDNPFEIIDKCLKHASEALIISVPYSAGCSGPSQRVGEHRYLFNECTLEGYHCRSVEITRHMPSTGCECIVYVLAGSKAHVPQQQANVVPA